MDSITLLDAITRQYLTSGDFNGFALQPDESDDSRTRAILAELVGAHKIDINFGDRHPNAHIQALDPEPVPIQLDKLKTMSLKHACAYPTPAHLATVVPLSEHVTQPFTRALALGEPQLSFRFFDLSVLETYRNDPRYSYDTDDIQGSIHITDEFYQSAAVPERDKVLLQQFGFGYDESLSRRVASVLLRDLSGLSAEHQQLWAAREVTGDYFAHPDYQGAVMGHWPDRASIFSAFIEELREINKMSQLMRRPPLFRNDFSDKPQPRKFGYLIRPTLGEYNAFVLLLDQLISDNISLVFFENDIDLETEESRPDGAITVDRKGSIRVLNEWLDSKVKFSDPTGKNEMIATFRKVRKLRQRPAHSTQEDAFDPKYFAEQRELIIEAYDAIRSMRLILQNHPLTKAHKVEDWLYKGQIWRY